MPGSRPRMTAGNQIAQHLDVPPGKAFPIGTLKLVSCHEQMGIHCDTQSAIFRRLWGRELFMPIG